MKKDTTHTIRRAEHFKTILTGEGFLVGLIAGLVVLLYRVLLEYAGRAMNVILGYARENPAAAGAWFVLLFLMACIGRKTGKVGAYDIRQRYSPGGRRNDRKTGTDLVAGASREIPGRISFPFWQGCLLEEKVHLYRSEP